MIVLGYDFHKNGGIEKPNGLIGQRINKSNRDTSGIFQLFLPPYLIEMFHKFKIDVEVDSVTNIKKKNLKQKWIYPLDCLGDPRGWLGKYNPKKYNSIKPYGYNLSSGGFGMGNLGKKITIQNKKFKSLREFFFKIFVICK